MTTLTPRRHRIKPGDQVLVFSEIKSPEADGDSWKLNSLGLGVFEGYFESADDDGNPMTEEEQVIYFTITKTLPVERIIMFDQGVVFTGEEVHWDQADVMNQQIADIKEPVTLTHTEPVDFREYLDYRAQNNADFKDLLANAVTLFNPNIPKGLA